MTEFDFERAIGVLEFELYDMERWGSGTDSEISSMKKAIGLLKQQP